jgi:hypothetical protein
MSVAYDNINVNISLFPSSLDEKMEEFEKFESDASIYRYLYRVGPREQHTMVNFDKGTVTTPLALLQQCSFASLCFEGEYGGM